MTMCAELSASLKRIARDAGGEAPTFAVMHMRDWWIVRRGPKWRYPLPEKRVFKPLPVRGLLARMMRERGHRIELQSDDRRAFVPSVFIRLYSTYGTLEPFIATERGRGRMKRRYRS